MEVKDYHGYKVFGDGTILGRNGNKLSVKSKGKSLVRVSLYYDGACHCEYLHKILAECFIPNPNNYQMVHHKDGDIYNNSLDNLIWTDVYLGSIMQGKCVQRIDKDGNVREYISLSQAGRENGCSAANIHNYIAGKQIDKKGFVWKMKE